MFDTSIFKKETIAFSVAPDPTKEDILRGGRDKFPLVKEALKGIKSIGVIGTNSEKVPRDRGTF
jgi:ketol-acid reductoisomerase